ncbi:hypothetical protein FOA52_004162 [Chlamydomonas sp. UWO 241]|nr:hypothetical protein FOA52_004162 [Chlamydomonas sp. UWO 241]
MQTDEDEDEDEEANEKKKKKAKEKKEKKKRQEKREKEKEEKEAKEKEANEKKENDKLNKPPWWSTPSRPTGDVPVENNLNFDYSGNGNGNGNTYNMPNMFTNATGMMSEGAESVVTDTVAMPATVEENKFRMHAIREFYKGVRGSIRSYVRFQKNFYIGTYRRRKAYMDDMVEWLKYVQAPDILEYYKPFLEDAQKCVDSIANLRNINHMFFEAVALKGTNIEVVTVDSREVLAKERKRTFDVSIALQNKLDILYNNTSIMNLIFDNQFAYMYVFKGVALALLYVSCHFSEKIFSEMYMRAVYAKNVDPPNLLSFYGIFLGFSVLFYALFVAILYILTFVLKSPINTFFAINQQLIVRFLIDLLMFNVLSGLLIIIVGQMIQVKKYFKYRTEGLRAIRAYKEVTFYICIVTIFIPYFLMF